MRSLEDSKKRWQQIERARSVEDLKSSSPELRSLYWKILLLFESIDQSRWAGLLSESRETYASLRGHFLRAIDHPDELGIDPLSENDESPWVALRADETLRAEIFQDVQRCMPENLYFRQPSTQRILVDILFVFCKLNADVGYRQGMHEILAPILWVVEHDAIEPNSFGAATDSGKNGLLADTLDAEYIEHDAFTLYGLVMQNAKSFFAPGPSERKGSPGTQSDSPMLLRSRRIFDQYLVKVDPDLARHLTKIDIVPQIFLMRWVRLLFGREFPFDEVLVLWDMLFAEDPSLEMVDLICVAMLLRIRWQLIEADTSNAFTILLKYSAPGEPASSFAVDALYLKDNMHPEGGAYIITKHGQKPPKPVPRDESGQSTPRIEPPLSPFGSPVRFVQQGNLESIFQEAAKSVMSRGEKWGVNKAVRDAVDDLKKNFQGMQSANPPSHASTRYSRGKLISAAPPKRTTAAADLLKRVSNLEARNKKLAKMLETAVAELWECQGYQAEALDAANSDKANVEALGVAIAKVQFVQVYLEEPSIPLPVEERPSEQAVPESARTIVQRRKDGSNAASPVSSQPESPRISATRVSDSRDLGATKSPLGPSSSPFLSPNKTRPSLAQSSFSWILGQNETGERPSSAFAASSAQSPFPSEERRISRSKAGGSGKGYLFGDDEEDKGSPSRDGKGKGKGKGRMATNDEWPEEEIIDLGVLGGKKGSVV